MTTKKTYFTPETPVLSTSPTKTPTDTTTVIGPYRTGDGWFERRADGKEYPLSDGVMVSETFTLATDNTFPKLKGPVQPKSHAELVYRSFTVIANQSDGALAIAASSGKVTYDESVTGVAIAAGSVVTIKYVRGGG